jgi:hypothetical protein
MLLEAFANVTPTIPLTLSKVTFVRAKLKLPKPVWIPDRKTAFKKTKEELSGDQLSTAP